MAKTNQDQKKKSQGTREQVLQDLQRVHKLFPDASPDRDFYRVWGRYTDGAWKPYFSTFKKFVKAAEIIPPVSEVGPIAAAIGGSPKMSDDERLMLQVQNRMLKKENNQRDLDLAHDALLKLAKENEAFLVVTGQTLEPYTITAKTHNGESEGIAFLIASDWHNEERVLLADAASQNEYNLEIFAKRAEKFFTGGQRLWDIMRRDQKVPSLVLALLGDFITGSIHEDNAESNLLPPSDAINNAEEKIASGIKFLLHNTSVEELIIPCHTGNHGRMTKKPRQSTEQGNSIELVMYRHLQKYFENEPRVKFRIADNYHSFMRIKDQNNEKEFLIRFHHGHWMKYGGGVGGITVPVVKAIAGWNTMPDYRNVDLDVFGHFHQYINYGNFVCNGSLIGYNAYATSIKARFEKPQQAFFMISRKYLAKTMSTPIFVE